MLILCGECFVEDLDFDRIDVVHQRGETIVAHAGFFKIDRFRQIANIPARDALAFEAILMQC